MSTEAPSLWELGDLLSAAFAAADVLLEASGGEYTPEVAALIDGVQADWEDKALRTAFYAEKRIPVEVKAIQAERARLAKRASALVKRRDWLREVYLPEALARQGRTEVRSPLATLKIGKGRARVVVNTLPEFLAPEYVTVTREVKPDKRALLAALEAGKKVEGAHLERKPVAKVS